MRQRHDRRRRKIGRRAERAAGALDLGLGVPRNRERARPQPEHPLVKRAAIAVGKIGDGDRQDVVKQHDDVGALPRRPLVGPHAARMRPEGAADIEAIGRFEQRGAGARERRGARRRRRARNLRAPFARARSSVRRDRPRSGAGPKRRRICMNIASAPVERGSLNRRARSMSAPWRLEKMLARQSSRRASARAYSSWTRWMPVNERHTQAWAATSVRSTWIVIEHNPRAPSAATRMAGPRPAGRSGAGTGGVARDLRESGRGRRAGTFPNRSVDGFAGLALRLRAKTDFPTPGRYKDRHGPSYGRQGVLIRL